MPVPVTLQRSKGSTAIQASMRRGSDPSSSQGSVEFQRPMLNRSESSKYLPDAGNRTRVGSAAGSTASSRRPSVTSTSSGFSTDSGDWVSGSSTSSSAFSSRKSSIASSLTGNLSNSRGRTLAEATFDFQHGLSRTSTTAGSMPNSRKPSVASTLSSGSTFSDWSFSASSDGAASNSRRSSMSNSVTGGLSPKTRTPLGALEAFQNGRARTSSTASGNRRPGLNTRMSGSFMGSTLRTPMSDYSDCDLMPLAFTGGHISAKQRQNSHMTRLSQPKYVKQKHIPSGRPLLNTGKNVSVGEMQGALSRMEQSIDLWCAENGYEPIAWPPLELPPGYSYATNGLLKDHGQIIKRVVDKQVLAIIQQRWPEMYKKLF